ncbi:MAG TPA: hypothetical protein VK419_02585 [Bryobacteraceae bacterium]|nr:hypothetical protein [Bryobacteraceae bacterium]
MKFFLLLMAAIFAFASDESSRVAEARQNWEHVREQVDKGLLPASKLDEAQRAIDDAADEVVLDQTLYATIRVEDLNETQAGAMVDAAQRRVDRMQQQVEHGKALVASDLVPPNFNDEPEAELAHRQQALDLAKDRAALVESILNMATAEADAEPSLPTDRKVEEIYAGDHGLEPQDIKDITLAFEKQFDKPLPVSARGETAVHRALGLDHTGRIDVALTPDSTEGVWLRKYLESKEIPYYAFRAAIPGKATAAHIHIGPGSTRLRVAD